MAKFVYNMMITIQVTNYSYGRPLIQMQIPISYSLFDLVQIIKLYTDYDDAYDWTFCKYREPFNEVSLREDPNHLENINFNLYRGIDPALWCNYGPIEIYIGRKLPHKYTKVYPTIYQAEGRFPTTEEFLNNIEIPDIEEKYTVPGKRLPSASHVISNELIDYSEKLKAYFTNRYRISDETEIEEFHRFTQNKLVRK